MYRSIFELFSISFICISLLMLKLHNFAYCWFTGNNTFNSSTQVYCVKTIIQKLLSFSFLRQGLVIQSRLTLNSLCVMVWHHLNPWQPR